MEFEQEPTNEQLDELLRDVVVPSDLKSQLIQISAIQESTDSGTIPTIAIQVPTKTSNSSWLKWVLAASLVGFGLFVASRFLPEKGEGHVPVVEIANNGDPKPKTTEPSNLDELQNGLAAFRAEQEQLEAEIHAIEVAQMEARLAKLRKSAVVHLDQREVESMIAAMSEEYSIPLGKSEAKVKSRMAQVIERYPGTQGAEIAQAYLSQANN